MGGTAPGGRIASATKPLIQKWGFDIVRAVWRKYLNSDEEARYKTPQNFAQKFGVWARGPRGKTERSRDVLIKWLIEEGDLPRDFVPEDPS